MKNFTLPMLLQVKVVNGLLCYLSGEKSKAVAGEMASSGRNTLESRFSSWRWCSLNHLKIVYVSRNGVPEEEHQKVSFTVSDVQRPQTHSLSSLGSHSSCLHASEFPPSPWAVLVPIACLKVLFWSIFRCWGQRLSIFWQIKVSTS